MKKVKINNKELQKEGYQAINKKIWVGKSFKKYNVLTHEKGFYSYDFKFVEFVGKTELKNGYYIK